jgi:hypothetical protein
MLIGMVQCRNAVGKDFGFGGKGSFLSIVLQHDLSSGTFIAQCMTKLA